MTSNLKRILLTSFIVICSLFFINIEDVKAVTDGDGSGYALCTYKFEDHDQSYTVGDGGYVDPNQIINAYKPYVIKIAFYKTGNSWDSYKAYADVGCANKNPNGGYGATKAGVCGIDNYNEIFHNASNYKSYFNSGSDSNPSWRCPNNVYLNRDSLNSRMSLYLDEETCNQNNGGIGPWQKCTQTVSLYEAASEQNGQPGDLNVEGYESDHQDTIGDNELPTVNSPNADILDQITEWGQADDSFGDNSGGNCAIIDENLRTFLSNLVFIISIIGIVLLIIMTIIEFIKVVSGQDDEGIKKAFKHTLIRAVCVIILLLLPTIITWIMNVVNSQGGKYTIGDDGNPICNVGE